MVNLETTEGCSLVTSSKDKDRLLLILVLSHYPFLYIFPTAFERITWWLLVPATNLRWSSLLKNVADVNQVGVNIPRLFLGGCTAKVQEIKFFGQLLDKSKKLVIHIQNQKQEESEDSQICQSRFYYTFQGPKH